MLWLVAVLGRALAQRNGPKFSLLENQNVLEFGVPASEPCRSTVCDLQGWLIELRRESCWTESLWCVGGESYLKSSWGLAETEVEFHKMACMYLWF